MSALTDRQKARERLSQVFQSILDKMIPADNSVPLEGRKFVEWEDQGDELARTMVPVALNIDWGTRFDGKQIQRWGEALGGTMVQRTRSATGVVRARASATVQGQRA